MASNSCTFIIVPDATSQCKRYNISKTILRAAGLSIVVVLFCLGLFVYTLFSEYGTMTLKVQQLEKLHQISLSQQNTIDRYEQDITQLSKNLAQIKQLNTRLMVLTGLDPAKDGNNLGLGGSDEELSEQPTVKNASK